MKALVLAAGYGTRMQGVIGDTPKALIEVGGKIILEHLLASIAALCDESDVVLVSNARYYDEFVRWREQAGVRVEILNDGTTEAANRLGAVGDMWLAVERAGIEDDLLIAAADNVFTFDFTTLAKAFAGRRAAWVGVRHNPDMEDQKRRGVVEMNAEGRLTSLVEKPARPASHWAAAPLYLLPAELVPAIGEYIASGGNADAPGYFMEYLVRRHAVFGWVLPGDILDVGNPASLAHARDVLNAGRQA